MKIGVFSDLHCGHLLGLTPWTDILEFDFSSLMGNFWDWFMASTDKYDMAFWLGDLVEGEGKHETTFHLTTDVNRQIDMAISIIKAVNAKRNVFVYGTPYHTGSVMDYEKSIAKEFGGDIAAEKKINVGGIKFDLAHAIGKSGTPTGGDIALKKEILWTWLYDLIEAQAQETADYIIRGHAHEFGYVGNGYTTAIRCPALKIGIPDKDRYARKIRGWYDVGFLEFDIEDGKVDWQPKLFKYHIQLGGYEKYEIC